MEDSRSKNNKRIAKNTFLLYFRMLFIMAISLYTSRVVLHELGVRDFGIYNVVGGVVAMFTILSGSLSSSISRILNIELGRNDRNGLKEVFVSSVNIQLFLSILVLLLAESVGVWFLNVKMSIDASRLYAANWVLQCSIVTFVVNLLNLPYYAAILAHERMKAYAYISIFEAMMKLLIVLLLPYLTCDKLISYSILLCSVAIVLRFVYQIYCMRHFEECVYLFSFNAGRLKEMASFAGWNFIGVSSSVLKDQGVNIAINLFCGVTVNAARAVSVQVNNAINSFVSNFMMALNPQITKLYAAGSYDYMKSLMQIGARLSFYLLLFFSLPVLIETELILSCWLGTVPEYSVVFVRLILILAMSEALSRTLMTAMLATGKIWNYQIVVGGLQMLNFPISYLLLKYGFSPEITMVVAVCISQCCLLARLFFLRRALNLSVSYYLCHVVGNVFVVSLLAIVVPLLFFMNMEPGFFRFGMVCCTSVVCILLTIYWVGCSGDERSVVKDKCVLLVRKYI